MATSILDSVEAMRKVDKSNMLMFCTEMAKHYRQSIKDAERITFDHPSPENIIIAGMGGSGIGGELLKDYARGKAQVPIEVSKDYHLPTYADKRTLVLLASYSGETEESLSSFLEALRHKCMIYCISSGGTLLKYAEKLKLPYLQIPVGMPPRAALPHLLVPLFTVIEKTGLVSGVSAELIEATKLLERIAKENAPEKSTTENYAKTLALGLNDKSPVIYGFGMFRGVAMRWKQQFNENSKMPSKWEMFSELNHNEIVGWENPKKLGRDFAALLIRDKAESAEIRSRIEITKAIIQPILSNTFEVWTQGKSDLAKILSTICIGDFTSIYLALLRKVDPTPVETISLLKAKLEENGTKEKIIRELDKI